ADGRLSLSWELHTNGGRNLMLDWSERGGPRVCAPRERGFGTTLIEQTLQAHGGEASLRSGAGGVPGRIRLPLPERDWPGLAALGVAQPGGEDVARLAPSDRRARLRG